MQDRKPCDSGRPPAENSTHSARANTPGHNGRQLTNREWEKHSGMSKNKRTENNRKLQLISTDSSRKNRNGSRCEFFDTTEARMGNGGGIIGILLVYNSTHLYRIHKASQWSLSLVHYFQLSLLGSLQFTGHVRTSNSLEHPNYWAVVMLS